MRPPGPVLGLVLSSTTASCLLSGAVITTQRAPYPGALSAAVQVPSADASTLRLLLHGNLNASGPGVYLAEVSPWPPEPTIDGVRRAYVPCQTLRFLGQHPPDQPHRELPIEQPMNVTIDCGGSPCEVTLLPGRRVKPLGLVLLPFAGIVDLVTFPLQVPVYFYTR